MARGQAGIINYTGAPVTLTFDFEPKLLFLIGNQQLGFNAFAGTGYFSLGFARTTTDEFSESMGVGWNSLVFFGPVTKRARRANEVISDITTFGSTVNLANVTSMGANALTITGTVGSTDFDYEYMVLGGDDVQVAFGSTVCPTSPGQQAITDPGFRPDCYMTVGGRSGDSTDGMCYSIGLCDGTRQGVSAVHHFGDSSGNAGTPTSCGTVQVSTSCVLFLEAATGVVLGAASHVSLDTLGWTLNWTVAPAVAQTLSWVALKGIAAHVGTITQPSAAGPQLIDGLTVSPFAVWFQGCGKAASASLSADLRWSVGFSDANQNLSAWIGENDNIADIDDRRDVRYHADAWSLVAADPASASTGTLRSTGRVTSFANGRMRLVWDQAAAPQRQWLFMAFGPLAATAPGGFTLPEAWQGAVGPIYWTTIAHRNAAGEPTRFPWAPISVADPADYHDGFKDGRLLTIGDINCPLSDRNGRLQIPTCDVMYSDLPGRDGLMVLRGMLGRESQRALRGKEFTVYCIADRDRRLFLDPVVVFRGFIDRYAGPADYQFSITAKGWIAKRFKQRLWEDRILDVFSEAPLETRLQALPLALGRLSDEGSEEGPVVFVADEAGRGGQGEPNPTSSYGDLPVAAPTGVGVAEVLGGGNIDLGVLPGNNAYVMVTRVMGGVEGNPHLFTSEDVALAPLAITADGSAVHAVCDDDGADAYRFYIAKSYFGIRWSHFIETTDPVTGVLFTEFPPLGSDVPITPGASFAQDPGGYVWAFARMIDGLTPASVSAFVASGGYPRPVRLAITPVPGALDYEFYFLHGTYRRFVVDPSHVNTNSDVYWEYTWGNDYEATEALPAPVGQIPPIHCGKFTSLTGFADWDGFLISARPCDEFEAAYLDGVRIDAAEYDAHIAAPGLGSYATWFGALPYTTPTGYTPYMVFLTGALRDRALGLNDVAQEDFRVNVKGHPNIANTGVETSIYEQLRMLAKNIVLPDAPTLKGDFDQEPEFTDGTPRLDDDALDQAALDGLAVIPAGPTAARWLSGALTVDEYFQDKCPSGKLKVGIKPNGQMVACVHNPQADPVASFSEQLEIIEKSFSFEATDQGFANAVPYAYGPRYERDGSATLEESGVEEDPVSQSADQYDERVEEPEPFRFSWRASSGAARQLARAFLAESKYLPQPATMSSVLHWLHRAPGEVVAVNHRQGATATGYTDRKHAILGMQITLDQFTVRLPCLDLQSHVGDLSFFQSEDFMAGRWIGGSRHDSCLTVSSVVVPFNYFEFVIDWDEIPGTHGQRARILTQAAAGTVKPAIFLAGEDPSGDAAEVEGTAVSPSAWDEQLLDIPRGDGEVRYWMLPILAGGATDADAKVFGVIEGYRL